MRRPILLLPLIALLALLPLGQRSHAAATLDYRILETRPHDPSLFTQGLIKTAQGFYESSGRYRRSRLVHYSDSSALQQQQRLPRHYFAEGLTQFNEKLFLLTWRAGRALVYNTETLAFEREHRYSGQGWGLTHNGHHLIMSDGSHRLSFRDPETFQIIKTLDVYSELGPWTRLNELEFIRGEIWANTWRDHRIVTINPDSGRITGILDLSPLAKRHNREPDSVLNGIAYDAHREAVWVTGKYWPKLYLLQVSSPDSMADQ